MRSLESAASSDFDELLKGFVTGSSSHVLRGFEINMTGAIGGAATGLQMLVADGCVFHSSSNESGTFYLVPSGTSPEIMNSTINTKVSGAFTPNAVNYVGIEYERIVDDDTSDQVYIWDPTNKNEITKTIPLAKILRYKIVISTSVWAANVLPIAKVTTDVAGNVVDVTDQRAMLFRLGAAGYSNPNPAYEYPWTNQSEGRDENPPTSTSNSSNPFRGGDKMIYNMKEWMDAVMTSFKEIKGTTYWYSENSGGSLIGLRADLANLIFTGKGNISHDSVTAGKINWSDDIYIKFIGGRLSYRILANPSSSDIVLSDDQVAYFKLVREQTIVPNLIWTNASAIVASVGAVAWTGPLVAGDWVKLATDDTTQYYQIQSVDSLSQVTLVSVFGGISTGPSGAKSQYAFGVYETDPAPSTDRHIKIAARKDVPFDEDTFWVMVRSDNGGTIPRVYARFIAAEIEQGETREINDTISEELLLYVGSPSESALSPEYVAALTPGSLKQITQLTVGNAASMTSNQYFYLYSSGNYRTYVVWVNKDGTGLEPVAPYATNYIEWTISTGDTSTQTASSLALALNGTLANDFTAVGGVGLVTVTNNSAGSCNSATNFDVGAPFAVSVTQTGTGIGNFSIQDGDSLTLATKELDKALGIVQNTLNNPSYDETVDIVSSGATPPTSLNGPITINTIIDLPDNSRLGLAPQYYTVGKGALEVYLNGQYLILGSDWDEVGAAGVLSNQIEILQQLEIGDSLVFRIDAI
jgi:hypothetical protein